MIASSGIKDSSIGTTNDLEVRRTSLSANSYSYVGSNPLHGIDVLGLQEDSDAAAAGASTDENFINKACGELCQREHGAGTPECDHCMTRCPIQTALPGAEMAAAAVPQPRASSIWSTIVSYFTSE